MDAIGDWWSLLIVYEAFRGLCRFGEFQRTLGCPKNILTVRLRTLVGLGVLAIAPASDGSAYQEYVLTEKGRALFPVIVALRQWGEDHLFGLDPGETVLIDRKGGRPVRRLELRSEDGRLLGPGDTVVKHRNAHG